MRYQARATSSVTFLDTRQHQRTEPRTTPEAQAVSNQQRSDQRWRLNRLVEAVEGQVIPRLILAGRAAHTIREPTGLQPSQADIVRFAEIVLDPDDTNVASYVEATRSSGLLLDDVYLSLLAPTARYLGELWKQDLLSFTEVTLGLCRLHQVVRENSDQFHGEAHHAPTDRRILLTPTPGEQHSFGLLLVGEFLRRSGWIVSSELPSSLEQLANLVGRERFNVVGLSLSCEAQVAPAAEAIRVVRRTSCNKRVGIMVGGGLFQDHPELVALVGADATAADGRQAALQAESLHDLIAQR